MYTHTHTHIHSTWADFVQERKRVVEGLRKYLQIGHTSMLLGESRQLVEVRGEEAICADLGDNVPGVMRGAGCEIEFRDEYYY